MSNLTQWQRIPLEVAVQFKRRLELNAKRSAFPEPELDKKLFLKERNSILAIVSAVGTKYQMSKTEAHTLYNESLHEISRPTFEQRIEYAEHFGYIKQGKVGYDAGNKRINPLVLTARGRLSLSAYHRYLELGESSAQKRKLTIGDVDEDFIQNMMSGIDDEFHCSVNVSDAHLHNPDVSVEDK